MTASRPTLKPICIVHGKNDYLRRVALDRIVERELAGGDPSFNLSREDGPTAECAPVLDDVRTFSLSGGRRVVVVSDADSFISRHRPSLERYTESPSESGCLILVCQTLDMRTRFAKAVRKVGEIVECQPAKGAGLMTWVSETASEAYGKRMGRRAAILLCEHSGTSQAALDAELSKLAIYVGDRSEITSDDVDALVACYREQNVFAVIDAMAQGDARKALSEWQQVLATDRAAPGRAIGGLAWALRRLLNARRRLDGGESMVSLARQAWTDVDLFAERMRRGTVRQREDQLVDLLAADLETKTGLGTVATAVDKFIVKHAMAAESR